MGVRAFSEDELSNTKPRPDLFERMERMEAALDAPVLTAAERESRSMTKVRLRPRTARAIERPTPPTITPTPMPTPTARRAGPDRRGEGEPLVMMTKVRLTADRGFPYRPYEL
jgi:hypothetical protein